MGKKLTHEIFMEKVKEKNERVRRGEIEIRGKYNGSKEPIECRCVIHDYIWHPTPHDLCAGCGCKKCGHEKTIQAIRLTHEEFVRRVKEVDDTLVVVGQYINYHTNVDIQCKNGHIWGANPGNLLCNHAGCPYCAGRDVWIGFNDLWTAANRVAKLLKNPDEGYKYTKGSHANLDFICPDCGNIINTSPRYVYQGRFTCDLCGDGVSYPNKFGRAMLKQLPVENRKSEYQPDWAKPYFYDNYFEHNGNAYILEMDGKQHFNETTMSNLSLEEIQERDEVKTQLALQHNINVIRIDCAESECEYIKKNIILSELNVVFDLSQIDWNLCDSIAHKNIVKDVCDSYELGVYNIKEIASIFEIDKVTVRRYLNRGTKIGWCSYHPINSYTSIALVNEDDEIIMCFRSIRECEKQMKDKYNIVINRRKLKMFCETKQPYKGFNFRFMNEAIQN